jgi:uncharacterized protein
VKRALAETHRVADGRHSEGPWRNQLADASSAYLRQHAGNPVDWHPWGPAAFARAKELDRPVFLSVGYAACHWCHVMERESFADPRIGALLNANFVAIKVDREEHPEVDALYMEALLEMTGEGGWPASLFLFPDGRAFHAGTYYPPWPRYGLPGFGELCERIADGWRTGRRSVEALADRTLAAIASQGASGGTTLPDRDALAVVVDQLVAAADPRQGGWGGGPKFPHPPRLDLMWTAWRLEPSPRGAAAGAVLETALSAMARGGLHDHLAGGFHRYTVDEDWDTPHFEKMLTDNALLARIYLRAWGTGGDPRWLQVGCRALEHLLTDLRLPDGGFAGSLDADSADGEGSAYTWTVEQVNTALGPSVGRRFARAFGVGDHRPFDGGGSVLRWMEGEGLLAACRARLLSARSGRAAPARSDAEIVAWNGMAVCALADAGRLLGALRYLEPAKALALRLRDCLEQPSGAGRILGLATGPAAVLEDFAWTCAAWFALHQATGDATWLLGSSALATAALARFEDPQTGALHMGQDPLLPLRRVAGTDGAEPAPGVVLLTVCQRLVDMGDPALDPLQHEHRVVVAASLPNLAQSPSLVSLLLERQRPARTVVIGGDPEGRPALRLPLDRRQSPDVIVAEVDPRLDDWSLLRGKGADGPARAWLCEGATCSLPLRTATAIAAALTRG